MKKILIINGHPMKDSFCGAIAEKYQNAALSSGAQCEIIHLIDLQFDPILRYGYTKRMEMEPDLLKAQAAIADADHIVLVYPNWWATYPALLKGFIDRCFVPGFAFKYRENSPLWDKLLSNKTARMIVTMDTPTWFYSLVYKNCGHNAIKTGVLEFSGIKPVKITSFAPLKGSSVQQRTKWLDKVERLGKQMI